MEGAVTIVVEEGGVGRHIGHLTDIKFIPPTLSIDPVRFKWLLTSSGCLGGSISMNCSGYPAMVARKRDASLVKEGEGD